MSPNGPHLTVTLQPDTVLDGYRLLRPIGRGGFGEVWLCQSEITGAFRALKFLSAWDDAQMQREKEALIRYQKISATLHSPHLLPIEHVNRTGFGFFYTMPLADGIDACPPTDPQWKPKTLAALIMAHRDTSRWFDGSEIRQIILPLLEAVGQLSDAEILHRDIKPDNILFVEDWVCLGDISLLGNDAQTLTQRGTPGYAAPSWYLESGGNPDMWGLATTFYALITGNAPDKLGRAMFRWPPQGESSVDRKEWSLFHQIILRATREKASERFLSIGTMREALAEGKLRHSWKQKLERLPWKTALAASVLLLAGWGGWKLSPKPTVAAQSAPTPVFSVQMIRPLKEDQSNILNNQALEQEAQKIISEGNSSLAEAETLLPAHMMEMQKALEHLFELVKTLEKDAPLAMDDFNTTFSRIDQLWPLVEADCKTMDRDALAAKIRDKLAQADRALDRFNRFARENGTAGTQFPEITDSFMNKYDRVKVYLDFLTHRGAFDFYRVERKKILPFVASANANSYIKDHLGRDDEIKEIDSQCRRWIGSNDQRKRSKGALEWLR